MPFFNLESEYSPIERKKLSLKVNKSIKTSKPLKQNPELS